MGNCQFCGKEMDENLKKHERFCMKNPDRVNVRKSQSQCDPAENFSKETHSPISSSSSADDTHKEPEPIIIVDIQPAGIDPEVDDVAWFVDEKGDKINKIPLFVGCLTNKDRTESVPCLLVTAANGTLLPPFMLAGFIGMFWKYYEFPDTQQAEVETLEDKPPEANIEPIISPPKEDSFKQVIIEQEKPGKKPLFEGIAGIFKKKENGVKPINETAELAKQIIDASGGTS